MAFTPFLLLLEFSMTFYKVGRVGTGREIEEGEGGGGGEWDGNQ